MRNLFLILTLTFSTIAAKAIEKEITVTVVFENLTKKELSVGELYIAETDERIVVTRLETFHITLPKKGKYQFQFLTDDFTAYTFYPSRITHKNNRVTIQLVENNQFKSNGRFGYPMVLEATLTDEEMQQNIEDDFVNFIMHGLDSTVPNEYVKFKEKYGVGLVKKNCVIDPMSYANATENNQIISNYLDKKYGSSWRSELEIKPFGIK